MSTGGNVPSQGADIKAATSEKKRGNASMGHPAGYVGKGTTGSRIKSAWRKYRKAVGGHHAKDISLRQFARRVRDCSGAVGPGGEILLSEKVKADATAWLGSK